MGLLKLGSRYAPSTAVKPSPSHETPRPAVAAPELPQATAAKKPAGRLKLAGTPIQDSLFDEPPPQSAAPAVQKPPAGENLTEIKGRITHLIFSSGDYSVYAVRAAQSEIKVAVTSSIKASKGDKIIVRGSWSTYKGKPTFKAAMLMHDIPKGARGVVTWLNTKAAVGVGKATADKLAKHFGDRLPDVVHDAELLLEAGIPEAKARAVADAWNNNASQPELIEFLGRFGLGEMTIAKIVRRYGGAARRIVRDNPWALAETIDGVGFQTADNIGTEAGHAKDSPKRISAGLRYALDQKTSKEGHCGLPRALLVDDAVRLLNLPRKLVEDSVETIIDGQTVMLDTVSGLIFPRGMILAEQQLARRLTAFLETGDVIDEDIARQAIEQSIAEMGVTRDESQIAAGVMALVNPVSIITGGPGTGKSTIQRAIVRSLERLGRKVVLASPTGRAAKRLAEVSGRPASTCHRLLSFNTEKGGFEFDASNPFEEDRFIIDEFSMVDLRLASSFMDAVKKEGGVTIVGDVDQLPSVGAGQVLRDLIESGAIPVTRLKQVHRQAGDSGIVVAAARINSGEDPVSEDETLDGFSFEEVYDPDEIGQRVISLMRDELPALGFDPIKDVQVLASMRKGDLGIGRLNEVIKAALNPAVEGRTVEMRKRIFSIGDRVMHLRNDYAKKVYNGEVGTVVYVGSRKDDNGRDEPTMKVDYSGYEAWYTPKDVEDVELSWAATVHKSQGCEFPVVIFICPLEHRRMLTRNLLYTAVTRAKGSCLVIGHERAQRHAVDTADVNRRHTGMMLRMREAAPTFTPPEGARRSIR